MVIYTQNVFSQVNTVNNDNGIFVYDDICFGNETNVVLNTCNMST